MLNERVSGIMDGSDTPHGEETPVFTSAGTPWRGFLIERHVITTSREELGWAWHNTHVVMCVAGETVIRVSGSAGDVEYRNRPDTVCIFPSGFDRTNIRMMRGGFQLLVAELDGACLEHLLHGSELTVSRPLAPQVGIEDAQVAALLKAMWAEVQAGCPAGALYAESLCLALTAYLHGRYAVPDAAPSAPEPRLSQHQVQRIRDYVQAHLGKDFSLSDLAAVVHLSSRHFSRLFRGTFGVTPYRYVVSKRISQAKAMLTGRQLSIVEISESLGFASQSHFTDVFRRATGLSPRRYRQSH